MERNGVCCAISELQRARLLIVSESLSKRSYGRGQKKRSSWDRRRPRLLVTNTGHHRERAGEDACAPRNVGFVDFELRRRLTTNHAPDPQSEDRSEQRQDESTRMKSGICAPDESTPHASNDRTDNTEDHCGNDAHWISARHNQPPQKKTRGRPRNITKNKKKKKTHI